ncbi:unnamed protein product [Peniophora sp. CBMAI 1063]|nr:unnamed protein product [Peniophora sp. CBMAI 1063]
MDEPDPESHPRLSQYKYSDWGIPTTALSSPSASPSHLSLRDARSIIQSGHLGTSFSEFVQAVHGGGILFHVFGSEEMCRRVLAVAVYFNYADPAKPHTVLSSTATVDLYREGRVTPLISNAFALRTRTSSSVGRNAHTYRSKSGHDWYIIDVKGTDSDLSRIIPLGLYVPQKPESPTRSTAMLHDVEPVPFWAVSGEGVLGVPVSQVGFDGRLQHGHRPLWRADGRKRKIVRIKVQWPGYVPRQETISLDDSSAESANTFNNLVEQVKGKLCKFILDNAMVPVDGENNRRWQFGDGPGEITVRNVLLLALVMEPSAVMIPILRVRDL